MNAQPHSVQRLKRVRWTALSNLVSRGAAALVMFLSVKLPIAYLGVERFGIWMTIAGFAGLLSFLDLGMGNALTNQVSKANAANDRDQLARIIGSGLLVLACVGLVELLVLALLVPYVPWGRLFATDDSVRLAEIESAVYMFCGCFAVNLVYSGLNRIFAGLQEGYAGHFAASLGSILACILLIFASENQASMPILILSTFGAQMVGLLPMLYLLKKRGLLCCALNITVIKSSLHTLMGSGKYFLIVQLAMMFNWGADSLIIASILGPTAVAVYAVLQKLFQFVSQPIAMINGPLWAAYADAYAKNDHEFVSSVFRKSLLLTVGYVTITGAGLVLFGQNIARLWTSGDVVLPVSLLTAYALWILCENTNVVFSMLLNAKNDIKIQAIGAVLFSLLGFGLKIVFIPEAGLLAVPLAMSFAFFVIYTSGFAVYKLKVSEKV